MKTHFKQLAKRVPLDSRTGVRFSSWTIFGWRPRSNAIAGALTVPSARTLLRVAACAALGCAGAPSIEENPPAGGVVADTVEVIRGVADRGRDQAVVAIDVAGEGLCSGTLIAQDAVLTARHCVARTVPEVVCPTRDAQVFEERAPSSLRIFAGDDLTNLQYLASGLKIVTPVTRELCDADIAVLLLDRNVSTIGPLKLRKQSVSFGDHVRAVGFGRPGDGEAPHAKLLRDHVPILAVSPHEFQVGEATCSGDSGGPALDESSGEIVGVVSRGGPSCEGRDVHNIYTRTDVFASLIERALAGLSPPPLGVADAGAAPGAVKHTQPKPAASSSPKPPKAPKAPKAPKPSSDVGETCAQASDCSAGVCVSEPGKNKYCSRKCGTGDRCPAHYHCTKTAPTESVCIAQ